MAETDPRQSAAEYFHKGYEQQMAGEYQQAIESYTRSIEAFPTAEAYTFRGWTYSFLGNYEQAIAECLQAIKVDPEFGNPYNDIGAYLRKNGTRPFPGLRKQSRPGAMKPGAIPTSI
jgi:tetratricopeptide (TPR) repeat protein